FHLLLSLGDSLRAMRGVGCSRMSFGNSCLWGRVMKRILLALSALAIGTAAASAADMAPRYTKAPPAPPPPPPCIWCGFYIGLNGGWVGSPGNNNNFSATPLESDESPAPPIFFGSGVKNPKNKRGFRGGPDGLKHGFFVGHGRRGLRRCLRLVRRR